jgi:hypothetical protein
MVNGCSRAALVAIVVTAAGCAARTTGSGGRPTPPPSAPQSAIVPLEIRAQQYWDRRRAKDLSGAYSFYCSEYRARVSQAQFLQMTRLVRFDLTEARIAKVQVDEQQADVTVAYRFLLPTLPGQLADGESTESWRRDTDGQWCKDDEPLVLPFPDVPPPSPRG